MHTAQNSITVPHRTLITVLGGFSALSAIAGGIALMAAPQRNALVPLDLLKHTPFADFFIPGLILAAVVGGTSLTCTFFAWRRSRATIDATILAGGALTVWIIAELAMLREAHWLHVVYGVLGLAILLLGITAGWRSRSDRHRWVIAVTASEALGFLVPAMTGVLASRAGVAEQTLAFLLVLAGLIEGLALGTGQAWAISLPVRRFRYALLTGLGASLVWALFMFARAIFQPRFPLLGLLLVVPPAILGLVAIGSAQWMELRHHAKGAHRWVFWSALAWAVALPLSFTPSSFVDESTPIASNIALWGSAGLLMAYVMALLTWQGVRRLTESARRASTPGTSRSFASARWLAVRWRSINH